MERSRGMEKRCNISN